MFSRIGNFLYHSSSVNKNSISYINKQNENITLDPSGTDYVEYSTDSDYFTEAHSLIPNSETQVTTTALKLQDSSTPANNFFFSSLAVSSLGDFTLCVKHKLNAPSTSTDIISHYFTSPQYDITLSVPYVSETIPFNVFVSKASDGPLDYEVSGNLTIADLTNGDISGTLSTVESVLPYTLNAGTSGKDFVFLLNDLDISLNTTIYTQYTVTVTDLDTTSPAFSLNGDKKQSITFTGGVSYVFDQSDSTNAGYRIVFGEAKDSTPYYTHGVTVVGTPGQPGAYTRIDYTGSNTLFYFSSEAIDMGYNAVLTENTSSYTNVSYPQTTTFTEANNHKLYKFTAYPTDISYSQYQSHYQFTLDQTTTVHYVVVGGGGAGGRYVAATAWTSAGGGGGEVIQGTVELQAGTYDVKVGSGGHWTSDTTHTGGASGYMMDGFPSSFHTITARGGKGGPADYGDGRQQSYKTYGLGGKDSNGGDGIQVSVNGNNEWLGGGGGGGKSSGTKYSGGQGGGGNGGVYSTKSTAGTNEKGGGGGAGASGYSDTSSLILLNKWGYGSGNTLMWVDETNFGGSGVVYLWHELESYV